MADGLRCCIWARAQSQGTVSLDLVKGWTNMRREAPGGNLGLAMEDIAWHDGSGLPEPKLVSLLPMIQFLAHKIVHFVVDYHPNWVSSLSLPPSDGSHRQLRQKHFQPALQRLQNMPETGTALQLFSAVNIYHKEWRGGQTVHAVPFKQPKPRKVVHCQCMYVQISLCIVQVSVHISMYSFVYVHICMYPHVYAHIRMYYSVYVHIRMYTYVFACICMYMQAS